MWTRQHPCYDFPGSAVFTFIWIGIRNTAGLVAFCLFDGCFSGAFISLSLSVVAATLCLNLGVLGVRIGVICLPTAIGFLIGNPAAGTILEHSWTSLHAFYGENIALATLGILIIRIMKAGKDIRVKCCGFRWPTDHSPKGHEWWITRRTKCCVQPSTIVFTKQQSKADREP